MLRLFGPDCPTAPVDPAKLEAIPVGARWLDLLNPTREEERLAEAALGQNIPTREEMAEIEPSSRLYERQGALFMTASVLHGVIDGKPDTDPVGFILTDKLLITVRYVDPKPFISLRRAILSAEPELAGDPLSILVRLLDAIVDRLADELEATAQGNRAGLRPGLRAPERRRLGAAPRGAEAGSAAAADRRGPAAARRKSANPRSAPNRMLSFLGRDRSCAAKASTTTTSKACRAMSGRCSTMTTS